MNEELQQAVAALINKAVGGVEATTEFLSGELPDYIYQLLMWYGISSLVQAVFGVVLLFYTVHYTKKLGKCIYKGLQEKKEWAWDGKHTTFGYVVSWFGLAITAFIAFLVAISNINIEWLQIWIAPKVWLVDYAAEMVKPVVTR